jgi:hypothetical protein
LAQIPFSPPNVGGWPTDEAWLSSASAQYRIQFAAWLIKQADLSDLKAITPNKRVAWLQDELGVFSFSARTRIALDGVKSKPYLMVEFRGEGADAKIFFDRREVILPCTPLDIPARATFMVCHNGYENLELKPKIANEVGRLPIELKCF